MREHAVSEFPDIRLHNQGVWQKIFGKRDLTAAYRGIYGMS